MNMLFRTKVLSIAVAVAVFNPIDSVHAAKEDPFSFKLLSQFRYVHSQVDDAEAVQGFETRRTRLFVKGDTAMSKLKYQMMYDFGYKNGDGVLFDAFVTYQPEKHMKLTAGQFRLPFNREQLVGIAAQLGMDRTQLNYAFNLGAKGGRGQGVMVGYHQPNSNFSVALSDGAGSVNSAIDGDEQMTVTGRYEHLFFGGWKKFRHTSHFNTPVLIAGFGVHVEDSDNMQTTGDISYQSNGFSVNSSFYTRHLENNTQKGFGLQLGKFISEKTEPFFIASYGDADLDTDGGGDQYTDITLGVNRFYKSNKVRLTFEVQRVLHEGNALFSKGGQGVVISSVEGQTIAKTQLQIVF